MYIIKLPILRYLDRGEMCVCYMSAYNYGIFFYLFDPRVNIKKLKVQYLIAKGIPATTKRNRNFGSNKLKVYTAHR